MEILRDKTLLDMIDKTHQLIDETNVSKQNEVISTLCDKLVAKNCETALSPTLLQELAVDEWIRSFCKTKGGKRVLMDVVSAPTYDVASLEARGRILNNFSPQKSSYIKIAELENSVLWILGMTTKVKDAYPLSMLFTCLPLLHNLNNIDLFVFGMYIFKGYIMPLMNVVYPTMSFLGPYLYVRRYLKVKMGFLYYLRLLQSAFVLLMRPSGNIRVDAFKYITFVVYVFLYLYTIFQGFEVASMLRKLKTDLSTKWERIYTFIKEAQAIYTTDAFKAVSCFAKISDDETPTQLFKLKNDLASLYKVLTTPELRKELQSLLRFVYVYDAICGSQTILHTPGWSLCKFGKRTQMYNMGHPMLPASQVKNPLLMNRNIIITGPNAAGKTTYMKSICANMIVAQSLGICCSTRAIICPVHCILSSMHIIDTVGKESLFEAEVRRCALLVKQADVVKADGRRALFFLDEPMHSTPPTEGTATAMAVAEYLGNTPGVFVFLTTHYHHVTGLETMYPQKWINVSMEAIPKDDGSFVFPYKLRKGPSTQCIALELLKERALPEDVIKSAIEMKNKICESVVDNVVV